MQSSFRFTPPTPRPEPTMTPARMAGFAHHWRLVAGAAVAMVVLIGAVVWWLNLRPVEGGTKVGRFGIALQAPWLAYSASPANRAYLGDPVWKGRFEGRNCVAYERYLACHDPRAVVRGTMDEFDLIDLGRRALPPDLAPKASRPDPVVQAYIDRLDQAGVPYRYWLGVPVSDAFCVAGAGGGTGECLQVFSRQIVKWNQGISPAEPNAVRLSPLGQQVPRP